MTTKEPQQKGNNNLINIYAHYFRISEYLNARCIYFATPTKALGGAAIKYPTKSLMFTLFQLLHMYLYI